MAWDIGSSVERILEIVVDGTLTDATGTPTYSVTAPDGTTSAPGVTRLSLGTYQALVSATQGGLWRDTWTYTLAGRTLTWTAGPFRVRATAPLVDLVEARGFLGRGVDPVSDDRLRDVLDAATARVEQATGYTYRRTAVVETHTGPWATYGYRQPRQSITLRRVPVLSVTTVTDDGTAVTDYTLDMDSGVLTRQNGAWRGPVVVTYTAGMVVVPDNVLAAVRLLTQQEWGRQSGAAASPGRAAGAAASGIDVAIQRTLTDLPRMAGFG